MASTSSVAVEKINQILDRYNFSSAEVLELKSRYPELVDLSIAKVKNLSLYSSTDEVEDEILLKLYDDKSNNVYLLEKNENELKLEVDNVSYIKEIKTFDGIIHNNLYDSILSDQNSNKLASIVSEAFKDEFSTTKGLRVQASYTFDVETFFDDGEFIKFGDVVSAKVTVGQAIVEKVEQLNEKKKISELKTYIPDATERQFISPIGSNLVSSLFNLARRHPLKRRIQPHNGIDFRAKSGTPVFPSLDGTVVAIGRTKAKGKYVLISHGNGFQTTYDHLRKFQKGLRVGMYVDTQDQLGEVGRTGYATGAHLHFCIIKNGQYVNPIYYLKDYKLEENASEPEELEEVVE